MTGLSIVPLSLTFVVQAFYTEGVFVRLENQSQRAFFIFPVSSLIPNGTVSYAA